ncbi:MAG: aminotransferase class III-fold pyridoxal phosphate-dependent enzyme [Acidobacteria bacterium]|nr:aminotransferase class III-fold pyridoxal phosphate-dependent enzyme [Acidobacteriota bacterium]
MDHAGEFASPVAADLRTDPVLVHDLSAGSLELGLDCEFDTTEKLTGRLFAAMEHAGAKAGIGGYDEARLCYSDEDFRTAGEEGAEYRTVHIGLDIFMPAGEPVIAPLEGLVHSWRDNKARHDYGPCIILEHRVSAGGSSQLVFHTLYGHLSRESLAGLRPGKPVRRGERIAAIGDYPSNGDWPPHLHFQVITDLLDHEGTFPGVARPSDRAVWKSLCPDPNLICGVPASRFPERPLRGEEILASRKKTIGRNLSVSYRRPLTLVRGQGQYLYDEDGNRYLDFYNNVPHVGHSHPHVVRAVQRQIAVLNTNTRYLHENLVRYAARLTATLPAPLRVCYFVCSGSEATELAVRLARAHTGGKDLIVCEGAYHGHTTTLIDLSPYKAEGPGGRGLARWAHKIPLPDTYRGKYRTEDSDAGLKYAREIIPIVDRLRADGRKLSSFLIESIPSAAGQILLPQGYLREAYHIVRAAGGVCIADEVQTGLGRIGSHFWAFQQHDVLPDIVAMGKPIGNGYPMGAVVTTEEIAASFANGMEYFVTFGGTPVSCAAGMAVLDVLEHENLQRNALETGNRLIAGLTELQERHAIIGDVRGLGLMLGVEFVLDPAARTPAPDQAAYVCDRLRERGVLIGTDGLDRNVLKIRGPMVLTAADADFLIEQLDRVLEEDAAKP